MLSCTSIDYSLFASFFILIFLSLRFSFFFFVCVNVALDVPFSFRISVALSASTSSRLHHNRAIEEAKLTKTFPVGLTLVCLNDRRGKEIRKKKHRKIVERGNPLMGSICALRQQKHRKDRLLDCEPETNHSASDVCLSFFFLLLFTGSMRGGISSFCFTIEQNDMMSSRFFFVNFLDNSFYFELKVIFWIFNDITAIVKSLIACHASLNVWHFLCLGLTLYSSSI